MLENVKSLSITGAKAFVLPPSFGLISQSVPQEVNQSLRRYNGRTQQRLTLPLILTAPRPFSSRSVCLFSPFQALFETSRAVLSFSMRFLKIKNSSSPHTLRVRKDESQVHSRVTTFVRQSITTSTLASASAKRNG